MEEELYVISFESTHYAIMMEKILKEKFKIDMIPTPRSITASCGLSIKIPMHLIGDIIKTLKTTGVDSTKFTFYHIRRTSCGDDVHLVDWQP